MLTQLEQVRWVLGGLLESKDLPSLWPIRVMLTNSAKRSQPADGDQFVWQNACYVLVMAPGERPPLGEVAQMLLDANTPRLPQEVESGLRQLFDTLHANGSRVTWGGTPPHPDLDWARMQLFATKFQYESSFHIFFNALKGSTVQAAEQNAFGKDARTLEQEAQANLESRNWQPVSVSGRPLDPKRDFGEHSLDAAAADVYLADWAVQSNPQEAEAAYKAAAAAGGTAAPLGYEGLAALALANHENPEPLLNQAIEAGSKSAPVYVDAADGLAADRALPLLKRAAQLNPLWAEPVFAQAELATDPAEKEALLRKATQLDARATRYWIELAQVQTAAGEATAAQGSWLRAEDSAPNRAEREKVHQQRLDSEQERLDAADAARREEREAVHLADQRAQDAETKRIQAAEEKANRALDAAAGGSDPQHVVAWDDVVPKKRLQGTLVKVDCLGSNSRIVVKDRAASLHQLFVKGTSEAGLTCGAQSSVRHVWLTYAAQPDDRFHTEGNVLTLQVQ